MKNNKGFTLAELLGVIALIAIIALIAVPAVNGVSNNIKKKLCESKIKNATVQAAAYAEDGEHLAYSNGEYYVTIKTLIDNKYLVSDEDDAFVYKNELKDEDMADYMIKVKENNGHYEVTNYDKLLENNCSIE